MGRGSKKAGGALRVTAALTSLSPGFRFHPTDEELVSYYLKRKVLSKTMCSDVIGEVDVYKHEPSELAVHAKLKTRDQEWFFFSTLDKKNPTGTNVNRATKEGYFTLEVSLPLTLRQNLTAPLPLIKYKHKRKMDSIGNSNCSSQTTQDHCSSTDTINDIADSLLELSNQLAMKEAETEPAATLMMHESSSTKNVNEQEPAAQVSR